jgi:arylsulfatase
MDAQIGRLLASLRENDELDNTLIIFLSDNGACAEWEPFGFDLDPELFRDAKPGQGINIYTGDQPNILHQGKDLANMGGKDSLFSYGSAWANLCNTPLYLYKHYAHEGGIRTPMIAHWPTRIADPGKWRDHLTHLIDLMPTVVEAAGAGYPKRRSRGGCSGNSWKRPAAPWFCPLRRNMVSHPLLGSIPQTA